MKVFLLGRNGQVGWEIEQLLSSKGFDFKGFNSQELDITNIELLNSCIIQFSPDIIINATAYTAVDKAENDSDNAFAINAQALKTLANIALKNNIAILHISTDYVFDGTKIGSYQESDAVSPLGVYGKSKELGECNLREILNEHFIIRTSWVFGRHGNNFVKTMLKLAEQRTELGIVSDQYGAPTYAQDIAMLIVNLISEFKQKGALNWGTYHFSGDKKVNWFEFAQEIFQQAVNLQLLAKAPKLNGIATTEYPTPAARPENSVLCLDKLKTVIAFNNNWQTGLSNMLQEYKLADKQWP